MRQKSRLLTLFLAFGISLAPIQAFELSASPELPRFYVDTTYVPPTGRTITVLAGGDFQAALDTALPGDVITLQAGATFTGPFTLHETTGAGWIVVQSSAAGSLPSPGTRVTASHASLLPKIVSTSSGPALATAARAHHFRFIGIEFTVAANVTQNYGLVQLGDASSSQSSLADVPHHLIFDRVYVHGNANVNLRRGFGFNSAWTAVIDSTISGVHEVGADSQAIAGWNGPGPFKIVNCYLEGAAENVLFGGADPSIVNLVPSDIEIRGNHFYKPLSWRIEDPSYAGKPWSVKNLFELKNARRVLVDGNVFENNWLHAQNGFAILFTVRNQDGNAPWSVVEDVTFTRNIVRHSGAGVNILGRDNNFSSLQTKRILIKDNCFEDVSGAKWGGTGRLIQVLADTAETVFDHNTVLHTGDVIAASEGPHTGFVYRNNLTAHNQYGVGGDGTYGNPLLTLTTFFPGAIFQKNVLMGGDVSDYPPVNYFPSTWQNVGFVDFALADYRLAASSPYRLLGTDGKDLGADMVAVNAATAGAVGGGGTPPSDTTPPSVSITSPAAGAAVSGVVSVSASASDNVGVASVEFKADGVSLGVDSTAPYAASWDSRQTANGQHTLTTIARDAAGNTASASTTVNVSNTDTTPPSVSITSPAAGAAVSGIVSISASASDNVGVASVEFKADGVSLSVDSTASYAATWDSRQAANGQHTLTAIARDAAGNTASASITVNVSNADTTPPSVSCTSPAAGAVVSGVVNTSANASDNVGVASVEFKVDGVAFGTDSSAPYAATWDSRQAANGQHTLTAIARDGAGNTASASITVNVSNSALQSPYQGQPFVVPGVIPAEDFDNGGEGVAYHDLVAGNQGGLYRTTESVDIIVPYAGGYAVNGFQTDEWLEYTITVPDTGFYRLEARVSSEFTTSRLRMEIDGTNVTGTVSVPKTASWKDFLWVRKSGIRLTAGQHVLRLYSEAQYFNVDSLRTTREVLAWTQMVKVTAAVGVLRKSAGCDGCQDAGAISYATVASGDLFMEVTASETTTQRAVGLSHGNSNVKVADIDFALQLWPGGGIDVRENGVYRAETTYASGDLFRIAVESSVVKYYKNGTLFYTSAKAPVYPLRVDSSLLTSGATLKNVCLKKGR